MNQLPNKENDHIAWFVTILHEKFAKEGKFRSQSGIFVHVLDNIGNSPGVTTPWRLESVNDSHPGVIQ